MTYKYKIGDKVKIIDSGEDFDDEFLSTSLQDYLENVGTIVKIEVDTKFCYIVKFDNKTSNNFLEKELELEDDGSF